MRVMPAVRLPSIDMRLMYRLRAEKIRNRHKVNKLTPAKRGEKPDTDAESARADKIQNCALILFIFLKKRLPFSRRRRFQFLFYLTDRFHHLLHRDTQCNTTDFSVPELFQHDSGRLPHSQAHGPLKDTVA